ncbi:MAG: glycosyltransferase family 4 protein [Endomicrobiales bacterium]
MNNILVVAHRIPHYNESAGDWRISSLCRALAKRANLFFLPLRYSWQNEEGYLQAMKDAGTEVIFPGDGVFDFGALLKKYAIDTVIFEFYYTAAPFIRYFPLIRRVVIDTHDLEYLTRMRKERLYPAGRGNAREARKAELSVYRMADTLVAISSRERKILKRIFPAKEVLEIPTPVEVPEEYPRPGAPRKDLVFFGYFLYEPNSDAVGYFLDRIFPLVRAALPGVRFHAAGFGARLLPYASLPRKEGIADIAAELSRYRVFVCPLRFGAGMKKKVLDAAAAGTPVVATSVGAEGTRLRNGREILVADRPADVARRVVSLYTDERLWRAVSRGAFEKVKRYYPVEMMDEKASLLAG